MSVEVLIVLMLILGKVGPLVLWVAGMCQAPAGGTRTPATSPAMRWAVSPKEAAQPVLHRLRDQGVGREDREGLQSLP
jgi:hypothetical protein